MMIGPKTTRNNNLPAMTMFKMKNLGKPRPLVHHNSSEDSLLKITDQSPKLRKKFKLDNIDVISKSWDSAGDGQSVKMNN